MKIIGEMRVRGGDGKMEDGRGSPGTQTKGRKELKPNETWRIEVKNNRAGFMKREREDC